MTPLGLTTSATWKALTSSVSAVSKVPNLSCLPVQIGAPVPTKNFPPIPPYLTNCPPFASFALAAAEEALQDADLLNPAIRDEQGRPHVEYPPERAGISIGVGMAHLQDIITACQHLDKPAYRKVTPFLIPRSLPNTPAGLVALHYTIKGPVLTPATACAAGAHALGDALHAIQRGDVDIMLAGGSESAINSVCVAGFARAKALSASWNHQPEKASRPFDAARDGFVLGEGACVMVLESEARVRERGAHVYAELSGFGMTGDAYHITSPPPDGSGAIRAMRAALKNANADASQVCYVNAHATSTPLGDAVERTAIASVLQNNSNAVVSSTKGATGHLLGAAGAVEAAFTVLSMSEGVVPPTLNLDILDDDEGVERLGWGNVERYVPNVSRKKQVDFALSNSFGFGGTNACVAFAKAPQDFVSKSGMDTH